MPIAMVHIWTQAGIACDRPAAKRGSAIKGQKAVSCRSNANRFACKNVIMGYSATGHRPLSRQPQTARLDNSTPG
jgi:hypothetical protein